MKRFLLPFLGGIVCMFASCSHKTMVRPEIPILAWYSIPDGENATEERYQELKDAGFTLTFGHIYTMEGAMKALDLSARVGIKSVFMCNELEKDPEETVKKVKNHPGLGAYFLRDEPDNNGLEELGKWARRIESIDTEHPCYLNLFPRHAALFPKSEDYAEHLRLFSEKVNLPQISYDHYPVNKSGDTVALSPYFYENLELVRAEARRTNKPFWAFSLSTAHGPYPIATIDHMRLQMYANLAYGAQCLQYFTYWNPDTQVWDFNNAPITLEGKRSPAYELVRELNQELQKRADVFVGSKVESVYHIGEHIPLGTHQMPALPAHFLELDTQGKGALVSTLKNCDQCYVVIQNTSANHPLELNIRTDETLKLVRRDGSRVQANKYGPLFILTVGDVLIFNYQQ